MGKGLKNKVGVNNVLEIVMLGQVILKRMTIRKEQPNIDNNGYINYNILTLMKK